MEQKRVTYSNVMNAYKSGLAFSYVSALLTLCMGYCVVIAGGETTTSVADYVITSCFELIVAICILRILAIFIDFSCRNPSIVQKFSNAILYIVGCGVTYFTFVRISHQSNICSTAFLERFTLSIFIIYVGVSLTVVIERLIEPTIMSKRKKREENLQTAKRSDSLEKICLHEAGHAVMAHLLGGKDSALYVDESGSGQHALSMNLSSTEAVRKLILIDYAGAATEELIRGNYGVGCVMGADSDFMEAVKYIKIYLILTDPSCSKTGLDPDINEKIVKVSGELYKEAKDLLSEHTDKIRILADALAETKYLSSERITEILSAEE